MAILVAVTGASGAAYARRLIEHLGERADVIMSRDAEPVIKFELGLTPKDFAAGAREVYRGDDLAAPLASGSHYWRVRSRELLSFGEDPNESEFSSALLFSP